MLAYHKNWLDALQIKRTARYYEEKNLLPDGTLERIEAEYPVGFYTPHWFTRIGLMLFGGIGIMAGLGLLFMVFSSGGEQGFALFCVFAGIGMLFFLEGILIKGRNHYRSGLDDVFAYSALGCLLSGIGLLSNWELPDVGMCLLFAVPLSMAAVRYIDAPLTLCAAGWWTAFVLMVVKRAVGEGNLLAFPLTVMACALGWYWAARRLQRPEHLRFWRGQLKWLEAGALLLFYVSGNFWCIEAGTSGMMEASEVPWQAFFWAFTMLVPFAYIALGLYQKDRLLLDIGIGSVAAALLTYRHYHSVLPFEWAITLIGAICAVGAWAAMRYLRDHTTHFTYAPDEGPTDLQKLQGNVIGRI